MRTSGMLFVAVLLALSEVPVAGATPDNNRLLGTPLADVASAHRPHAPTARFAVTPSHSYQNAGYGTGGVALRNRREGVLQVSGVAAPVTAAWVYFAYLYATTPPTTTPIAITRLYPAPSAAVTVKAELIGTGGDPCWGSTGAAVYRGAVPARVANGDGVYKVVPSIYGLTTGDDPWNSAVVFPSDEGASLVLIGSGTSTVDLFDNQLAGNEFQNSLSYTLNLSSGAGSRVLMDSIGADGQLGTSRTGSQSSMDTVFINSIQISGNGSSEDTDSDWNGSSGFPLPQLWDDTGHDISVAAPYGTTTLSVTINAPLDCLVTIGNVVSH